MMNPESKRQVTVEDIIRLKRAERPPTEFWAGFEQELRAKQLAAIIAKKPWWRSVPRLSGGWRRYHLPLGATAILAVTFFSLRDHNFKSSIPAQPSGAPATQDLAVISAPSVLNETSIARPEAVLASAAAQTSNEAAAEPATLTLSSEATGSGNVAQLSPWLVGGEEHSSDVLSPTAESIAANLATARETHPELVGRYLGSTGFEKRGMPERKQAVDPLTQMKGPADLHRERLLSNGFPVAATVSMRSGERVARRISDDRLTEELGMRFGARGDSFTLKF